MPDDAAQMEMIRSAQVALKSAEGNLRLAKQRYAAALAAHDKTEGLAKQLWRLSAEFEDDSADLIEAWEADPSRFDHHWISLNIESERDEYRMLAAMCLDIAGKVR